MKKRTFFFDHAQFLSEAKPYIQRADQGDYEAILHKARSIASNISSEQWVLEGLGTSLSELDAPEKLWQVGSAFLVLLSEFLEPIPSNQFVGWTKFIVSHFSWSEEDIELLSKGMTIAYLMKPELVSSPLFRPTAEEKQWHDPSQYWWYVRPANAYNNGWLSPNQIADFERKLVLLDEQYAKLDISQISHSPNTTVTLDDMKNDYEETVMIFRKAIDAKVGLFFILA